MSIQVSPLPNAENNISSSKTEVIVIKKAKVNLNRIKKYMLRNLFQENKGDYSAEREAFLSLSFDKFLECRKKTI